MKTRGRKVFSNKIDFKNFFRRQEEAWARLDRCPTPNTQPEAGNRFKR